MHHLLIILTKFEPSEMTLSAVLTRFIFLKKRLVNVDVFSAARLDYHLGCFTAGPACIEEMIEYRKFNK